MVLSEGTTEKIPSDTTGDRSRDRPASSAVSRNQCAVVNQGSMDGKKRATPTPIWHMFGVVMVPSLLWQS